MTGSKSVSPPPTPPPLPSKDAAAEAAKDTGAMKRRGYQSTILGGRPASANAEMNPLKSLLGQ
jgi:hypothetical protein